MKPCRRLLRVAALLSVLLVVSAQCFGIGRAFHCLCTGFAVTTHADHCHDAEPCAEEAAACEDEDRHEHAAMSEPLESVTPQPVAAPELVPVLLAILPQDEVPVCARCAAALRDDRLSASRPPPSVAVTRAVEYLI